MMRKAISLAAAGVLIAMGSVIASTALTGCTSCSATISNPAATVNGTMIPEDKVTEYIQQFREENGLADEVDWREWLSENGHTPSSFRSEVLDRFVDTELEEQAARKYGVSVSDGEVEKQLEAIKGGFDSDEEYQLALEVSGLTEESYKKDVIYATLLRSKLAYEAQKEANGGADGDYAANWSAYNDWFYGYKADADIEISDMPGGLPYAFEAESTDANANANANAASNGGDEAGNSGSGE